MEPGLGVGGRVLSTGEPFVTEHYLTDPRVSQTDKERGEISVAGVTCTRRGADPPWRHELPVDWGTERS